MQVDIKSNPDDILPFVELVCIDIHRHGLSDVLFSGYFILQLVSLVTTPRQGIDFMAILDVVEAIKTERLVTGLQFFGLMCRGTYFRWPQTLDIL